MKRVVINILHYKNEKLTDRCIESIKQHTDEKLYHILVIDNGSPKEYVRNYENVSIIRRGERDNVKGMNFGFYYALYQMPYCPDYIVNFDNDIICMENWLEPLIEIMDKDPEIGITGGKQWNESMEYFCSVGVDLIGGLLYKNHPKRRERVIWIQGSFVMMRSDMMRMIGLHDERYITVCSDSDYCINANDRGYPVVFVPESNVIHIGGASYGGKCETGKIDNDQLVQKWSGMKFMGLMKKFPLVAIENQYLTAKYKVERKVKR